MKKIMIFAAMMLMTVAVFAQQGSRTQMTPEQRAERIKQRIEAMDKAVGTMTADEKTKVEELFKTTEEKMAELRTVSGGDMQAMRGKMTDIREAQDVKLKSILGEERFKKYEIAIPQRGQGGGQRPQRN